MAVPIVGHAVGTAEVGRASWARERAEDHDLRGDGRGVAGDGEPAEPQALDAGVVAAGRVIRVEQVDVRSSGGEVGIDGDADEAAVPVVADSRRQVDQWGGKDGAVQHDPHDTGLLGHQDPSARHELHARRQAQPGTDDAVTKPAWHRCRRGRNADRRRDTDDARDDQRPCSRHVDPTLHALAMHNRAPPSAAPRPHVPTSCAPQHSSERDPFRTGAPADLNDA